MARVYEIPAVFSVSDYVLRVVDGTREDYEIKYSLLFLHEKIGLSRLTLHIALFYVLSDSRYYLNHHQHVLVCKSRDSQRRRPLVDQLALYLTYVVPRARLCYEESLRTLAALLLYTRIEFTLDKTKLSMSWWRVTRATDHPPGTADTGFLTAEETWCGPLRCELSSKFMSVGGADIPYSQLFGGITCESRHLHE